MANRNPRQNTNTTKTNEQWTRWQTSNNDAERATTLAIANLQKEADEAKAKANKSSGLWGAVGSIGAALFRKT